MMRVNVYAEEMTDRIEIISKNIDGESFTGVRFYLYLPASYKITANSFQPLSGPEDTAHGELKGPFVHRPGDDDSAAVTFWGKRDLRDVLRNALKLLDDHYNAPRPA